MSRGTARPAATIRELRDLTRLVQRAEGFPQIVAALRNGHAATVDGAWGSASPLSVAALGVHAPTAIIAVLAHVGDVDDFVEDLANFTGVRAEVLPAWSKSPTFAPAVETGRTAPPADSSPVPESVNSAAQADPDDLPPLPVVDEVFGQRVRVLKRLSGASPPRFIVAPIQAVMQPVPKVEALRSSSRTLRVGDTTPVEEFVSWLTARGLQRAEVVEVPGEFSLRGGILDIYPPDASEPVRLEFFGDEVESIRPFDPESQRSLDRWEVLTLSLMAVNDGTDPAGRGHFLDYVPDGTWIALVEPDDLREQARQFLSRAEDPRSLYDVEATLARLTTRPTIAVAAVAGGSFEATCHLRVESIERFSGDLARVKSELDAAAAGEHVLIACHNAGEAERLGEVFADTRLASEARLTLTVGRLRSGFHLVDERTLVLSDHELFARTEVPRQTTRRRYESRAIDSFLDLNEGDLVVHLNHGIAFYRGLQLVDRDAEHGEEQLVLEFAERTRLFVPIAQIDLVQKYVGGGRANPPLSRIGSSAWEKRKKRVAEAVVDLASELLEIQAQRASKPGFAYPAEDSHWQAEFEAAFPYQPTPDQLSAIEAIKIDMARPQPMDRLLCGDVGYGKTEVAMRAAFKAVEGGKQVAVLVPTTVLAEQHYRTFIARMAEYPITIEAVHRFRVKSQIRETLERAAAGAVDILIGTHRLVQKDVVFRDLGLVIIDEEQRFGVEDKEWLKSLRATVDVLTLSATPIPRTLHMSLLGIRDISNLETPPVDRKAIETRIGRWDDELIRRAIHRELNRDGQVYFVHNRVYDIESVKDRVQALVPEARILVGHGQMPGEQLERAMMRFVRKEADILLATTIIESGLDIPNVNTIFIHEADRYGLSDLHQLRGRVGRYKHRAYAYLLLEKGKPTTPNALRRLKAIEEFTDLGAGFKIALRDLEIRGAGNILGAEQSGHIEAVGYELYCTLLEAAVRTLKQQPEPEAMNASIELGWRAYLPRDYVPGAKLKLELYRRVSRLRSLERLADFRQELLDRFGGPLPPPAENLLAEAELRILAARWQLGRIHIEDEYAVLTYKSRRLIDGLARTDPDRVRIVDDRTAYVPVGRRRPGGADVARVVRELLTGEGRPIASAPPKERPRRRSRERETRGPSRGAFPDPIAAVEREGSPRMKTIDTQGTPHPARRRNPDEAPTPVYESREEPKAPAPAPEPVEAPSSVGLGKRLKARRDRADLDG